MQYQQIQTQNGSAGYITIGYGQPLVMILRYGATLYNWDQSVINQLSKHFTLYLIEPPLIGQTTGNISPNIQGYAAFINEVLDALSISQAILCGWSFGGAVVQEFSRLFPLRLSGLVFLSSFTDSRFANPEFVNLQMGNEELSKDKKERLFELLFSQIPTPELSAAIKQSGLKIDNYNYRLTPESKALHDKIVLSWNGSMQENLSMIKVPTLVLRGLNDKVFAFDSVEQFIRNIPNSKLIVYPEGGHLLLHYHPAEIAGDIINYFNK